MKEETRIRSKKRGPSPTNGKWTSFFTVFQVLRLRFFNLNDRLFLHRDTAVLIVAKLNDNSIV